MASTSTYPQTYLSSLTSYESREAFAASQRAHENSLRALFAQGATDPAVRNPYTNLIQVHDAAMEEAWKYAKRFEEDAKVPVLFPLATLSDPNKRSVVSRDEFLVNWRTFTEGSLQYLDWSNVFAAGGAVQACLSPLPAHVSSTNIAARRDHLRSAFPAGDIDLFIWGVDEEGAKKKMEEIYEAVKSTVPFETVAIRSSHAVTIVSQFPFRHIQIILRLYHSPTEILAGFDVDSCAFGFDGAAVYCSPRSHLASVTRRNTVDMSRRSPSYEVRLAKYAMRGFEIEVGDSLKRDRIDPQIFERPFDKLQGLARLLLLEAFPAPSDRMSFKEASRERRLRPKHERAGEYRRRARGGDLTGDGVDANDYSSVFMPYGEGWNARRIVRQAQKKDYVLNAPYTRKLIRSTSHHQHPCFWGDMSEIFHDCCKQCPPLPADVDPKESDLFVRGPLTFITDDPGRQHVGSFNPITEGDWTAGAYISEASEGLFRAVAARDVNGVRKAIESGADVNGRDHAGRAPLHLAAVCGATEVVKVLLDAGSKISVAVPDGRGVLHLCAEYGALEEAKIVLAQNKKNIDAKTARETAAVAGSKSSTDDDEGSDNGSHGGKTEEEYDIVSKSDESFVDVAKELGESKQKEPFNPFKAPAEEPEAEEPPADDIIDIEFEDWDMKMTALHFAIFYGELDLAKLFLQAGASKSKMMTFEFNVNSWTKTKGVVSPLVLAMMCPDREAGKRVLTYLLEENFPVNQVNHDFYTPLAIAVRHGLTEFVRLLLEEHPRTKLAVNFPVHDSGKLISPMKLAVDTGDLAIVKLLHEAGSKVALDESDVKRGMAVINKGTGRRIYLPNDPADVVRGTVQPLQAAVVSLKTSIVSFLLDCGADPNIQKYQEPNTFFGSWRFNNNNSSTSTVTLLDTVREKSKEAESTLLRYSGTLKATSDDKDVTDEEYFWNLAEDGSWKRWLLDAQWEWADRWSSNSKRYAPLGEVPLSPDDEEMGALLLQEAKDTGVLIPKYLSPDEIREWNIGVVKKRVERIKACEALLVKSGAKPFVELKNTTSSISAMTEEKQSSGKEPRDRVDPLRTAYQYYGGEAKRMKSFKWTTAQPGEEADRYHALFDACFRGDATKILELTVNGPPGKEALVACRVSYRNSNNYLNLFAVSILFGHSECLKALLEAASRQYAAVPVEDEKEKGKIAKLSNRAPLQISSDDDDESGDSDDDLDDIEKDETAGEPLSSEDHDVSHEPLVSNLRAVDMFLVDFTIQKRHLLSHLLTEEESQSLSRTDECSLNAFSLLSIRGTDEMWKYVLADLQALDAQLLAGTFGTLWNNRGSRDGFMPKRNFCSELANGAGGLDSELNQSSPTYWAITTGNVSALRILIRNGLGGLSPVVLLTRMEKEKREEAFSKAGVTGGESVASDPAPAGDKFYRKLKLTWGPSKKAHDEDHEDDSGDDDFFSTWSPVKASPCHVAALQGRNSLLNYLLSDELDKDVDVFTSSYPDDPRSVAFRTRPQERELFIQVVLRGQAHPHYGDQTVAHYTAVGRNPDGLRAYMRWVSHTFGEDKARTYVNTRNRDGITPLHFAASRGYDEMVEALLEVGAECSEMDYARGWNAAHFASYHGKVGSLTQFISKLDKEKAIKLVCQPSRVFKHTPLMVATSQGHHRVVDLLTKFTSSATTNRDFMSRSALDLAVRGSYVDTVKRLLANGTLVQDSLSHEDVVGLTPFGAASHILRGKVRAGEFSELLPKKQPVPVEWPSRKPLRPVNDDDEEKIEIDAVEVYRVLTAIQPAASSRKPSELEEVHASMQSLVPPRKDPSAPVLSPRDAFMKTFEKKYQQSNGTHDGQANLYTLGNGRLYFSE